jgi:ribonuclease HI
MSVLTITANAAKEVCAQSAEQRWCRLEARQVKVNVYGSSHQDEGAGAIGAVPRDHKSKFIAASMTFIPNLALDVAAEALALGEGLCPANRLGCSNVIAESDSLETIQACSIGGVNQRRHMLIV